MTDMTLAEIVRSYLEDLPDAALAGKLREYADGVGPDHPTLAAMLREAARRIEAR